MTGTPRQLHLQVVHFLRKQVVFGDTGKTLLVGTLPAGALIIKPMSGVQVVTVFNHGTNNLIDIGVTGDTDLFGTDLSLAALAFVPLDEAIGGYRVAADVDVFAVPDFSGTAGTTGDAEVVIAYVPDNDG